MTTMTTTPDKLASFITAKERGEKLVVLTAYDYPTARLLEEASIDLLLVGDSLGMVVLGYENTTHVTMEEMLHHTRAVARGVQQTPVVADLPYLSYETPEDALRNGQRLIAAGADAVKLEGGVSHAAQIRALTSAGIPVMGHIGMLPQSVVKEGGYKIKGRDAEQAEALKADALAIEDAGAFSVVLELVHSEAAAAITAALRIPTIGIGSGNACDGQVLVTHDLIGLFPWFRPKFATARADVATSIRSAAAEFSEAVRDTKKDTD